MWLRNGLQPHHRSPGLLVLVALRQLSLPYGNRAFLRAGRRCPHDLRSARLSQAKSSSFFTSQRRKACGLAASQ